MQLIRSWDGNAKVSFPHRYIKSVKSPDGHVLRSNCEIRKVFQVHFRDRFARLPDLSLQKFRSYLTDFPRLLVAEAVGCEVLVTECEVRDTLKQVGLNKSPDLDSFLYEVYLRMSHVFGPTLTDVFNHWFTPGAIPSNITKGVLLSITPTKMSEHIHHTRTSRTVVLVWGTGHYIIYEQSNNE